jgi:hypothetical protein
MTSSMFFNSATLLYLISMLAFFAFLASKNRALGLAGSYTAYAGLLVQTIAIGLLRCQICTSR